MPVRPAHWLSSSCHILSDRLSAGFSCGLCSGRSAVLSSVQPADLLRPDSAALPVLHWYFRPAFFLNRATRLFSLLRSSSSTSSVSLFLERQFVVGLRRFPLPYQAPVPSPGVSVGSVCLTGLSLILLFLLSVVVARTTQVFHALKHMPDVVRPWRDNGSSEVLPMVTQQIVDKASVRGRYSAGQRNRPFPAVPGRIFF